jgi:hypothetical protein
LLRKTFVNNVAAKRKTLHSERFLLRGAANRRAYCCCNCCYCCGGVELGEPPVSTICIGASSVALRGGRARPRGCAGSGVRADGALPLVSIICIPESPDISNVKGFAGSRGARTGAGSDGGIEAATDCLVAPFVRAGTTFTPSLEKALFTFSPPVESGEEADSLTSF